MAGPNIRRLYFSTREVCSRIGISQAVLRNWEQRFTQFKPARSQSGRKLYRPADLKLILRIKQFKDAGYADEKIESILWPQVQQSEQYVPKNNPPDRQMISQIRNELKDILSILDAHSPTAI